MVLETPDERTARFELEAKIADERIRELVLEVEQLTRALESRGVIDQAKGVLMNTMRIGPDAAFAVLVAQSQAENRKLREIAAEIVSRQESPDAAARRRGDPPSPGGAAVTPPA